MAGEGHRLGDALTCADLQRELQKFAKEKLPDLFQAFAEETAKISCEQLREVLSSQRYGGPTLRAAATAMIDGTDGKKDHDHEWAHRHIRPAAVREASKPSQHTSVKEIWRAVVDKSRVTQRSEHEAPPLQIVPQASIAHEAPAPAPVLEASEEGAPLPGSVADEPADALNASPDPPNPPDPEPQRAGPAGPAGPAGHSKEVGRSSFQSVQADLCTENEGSPSKAVMGRKHQNAKDTGWDALVQRVQHVDTTRRKSSHDQDEEARTSWWHIYEMLVYAWPMEYLTLAVILFNAFCLGLETNIMATNLMAQTPEEFIGLGWAFCAFESCSGSTVWLYSTYAVLSCELLFRDFRCILHAGDDSEDLSKSFAFLPGYDLVPQPA